MREILASDEGEPSKRAKLKMWALEAWASTNAPRGWALDVPGLADSINDVLRTEAMIFVCKTANRNFIIAMVATGVAIASMAAAWAAVFVSK